MTQKYVVYTDTHKFGTHPYPHHLEFSDNTIFTGDIVDRANVLREDLEEANRYLWNVIKSSNGKFASGNHERMLEYPGFFINPYAYAPHSDIIFYGEEKYYQISWY